MAISPNLKVLFFDVFGTCVAQRGPVADELWNAAREALGSSTSVSLDAEVRRRAEAMTYEDWFDFGGAWNKSEDAFISLSKARHAAVDWHEVDRRRIESLGTLLADRGLVLPTSEDPESSTLNVKPGSLWIPSQLQHLARIWHRLPPWPDTIPGLELLNERYVTVTLSNTYETLIRGLVAHGGMPFNEVFSADMFDSYKPDPKVYLGAAERLGVKPEECGMVAAHLGDLKGAKACGFYAIYVERELEEKAPELRGEGIPDLVVREGEGGFVELARRLGVEA